jgi:CRP-like cAMP-binding protein
MASLDLLRNVDILMGLSEDRLSSIGKLCHEKSYAEGDVLFSEGQPADHLFLTAEGAVDLSFSLPGRVRTPATTIVSVPKGRAFGWSSLMPPYRYRLNAHCTTETCKVLCLEREPLRLLFNTDMQLGYQVTVNLTTLLSARFRNLKNLQQATP